MTIPKSSRYAQSSPIQLFPITEDITDKITWYEIPLKDTIPNEINGQKLAGICKSVNMEYYDIYGNIVTSKKLFIDQTDLYKDNIEKSLEHFSFLNEFSKSGNKLIYSKLLSGDYQFEKYTCHNGSNIMFLNQKYCLNTTLINEIEYIEIRSFKFERLKEFEFLFGDNDKAYVKLEDFTN